MFNVKNILGFVKQDNTPLYMSDFNLVQTDNSSVYYAGGFADVTEYDKVNDFSSIANTGVNQDLLLFTTKTGKSLYLYVRSGYGYYFKSAPGGGYSAHPITSVSTNMAGSVVTEFDVIFVESDGGDNVGNKGIATIFKYNYGGATREINVQWSDQLSQNINDWLEGSDIPTYTWTAWDQISGNNGQYRCNLTMIKDSSIGDFSQIYYGADSDMSRISGQADLMNIFHNMVYDQERTIAWSGDNWMSLTLHTVSGLPNQAEFVFKFYVPSVSATSPIYTQSFNVVWNGTYKAQHFYLSFVHDDEQQAALFAPVEHMYNGQYNWGYNSSVSSDAMLYLWLWLQSSGSPAGDSPYSTGTTDNGGTPGGGMPQSHIDVPTPPTLGGTATGMFTVYCPTETQMAKISAFLWSADTITNIRKYFNNFSENIMAFYVLPCKPTNNPTKVFTVGNMSSSDTDLQSVEYISNRFIQIDMGDLLIEPFWDSYLDYAPYSKMEVYLPGIGVQPLDVDDIMCPALQDGSLPEATGSRLHIDYNIDLMTGVMVACISINGEMRYQFPGKMGYTIPLTGENYTRLVQGYVTATAGLIGTIATGGAAAPFAAGATAAGIINAMKPDIYRGGNLSGDSSMLSRKTPMLIYRRPNKAQLIDQEKYTGFPSYKIDLLSNFTGYTEVIDCHVEGISCTEEERDLILAALKGGVII